MFSWIKSFVYQDPQQPDTEKTEIAAVPAFSERLKAIGYSDDLIPEAFLDPVHLVLKNKPIEIKIKNQAITKSIDGDTLNSWFNTNHKTTLAAVLERSPGSGPNGREAFCEAHALTSIQHEPIHTIQPDTDLENQIENFVTRLERIHALKKRIAAMTAELDEQLVDIHQDTLIKMNPELDLRHIPRLLKEQKDAVRETEARKITEVEMELVHELDMFIVTVSAVIRSTAADYDDRLEEYHRIVKSHVALLHHLRDKLAPLTHHAASSSQEPSSSNDHAHTPFSIPCAALIDHAHATFSIPCAALIDATNTPALIPTDAATPRIDTNMLFFRLLASHGQSDHLISASSSDLNGLAPAEERELRENFYHFLRRHPPHDAYQPPSPASHVQTHGVFNDARSGSRFVLSESEPSVPKRVFGISPGTSPKR